jgi:hypothetical protein
MGGKDDDFLHFVERERESCSIFPKERLVPLLSFFHITVYLLLSWSFLFEKKY